MYTSILLVALTGMAPTADSKSPSWSQDYAAATKQAAQAKRPLAIVLAPGQGAYEKLGREGGLGADAQQLLAAKYVCLHIDTSTSTGKELAQAFRMPDGFGIVISDSKAESQAFRHQGDLARADLVRYLERYADPNRVAVQTESNPEPGTRAVGPVVAPYAPAGYCPSCSSCSGGRCRR
jgi:hypothetical protein